MVCDLGHFSFTSVPVDPTDPTKPTEGDPVNRSIASAHPSDVSVAVEDIDLDEPADGPTILAMSPTEGGSNGIEPDEGSLSRGTVLSRSLTINSTEDFDDFYDAVGGGTIMVWVTPPPLNLALPQIFILPLPLTLTLLSWNDG